MSHMVIYRGADGKPGYQQAEDIHDAVTFVEQMRNTEGVEQARIFRLEEVVFEYRPYYRVELAGGAPDPAMVQAAAAATPAPSQLVATQTPAPAPVAEVTEESSVAHLDEPFEVVESTTINVDDPEVDVVAGNGARRGLFGR